MSAGRDAVVARIERLVRGMLATCDADETAFTIAIVATDGTVEAAERFADRLDYVTRLRRAAFRAPLAGHC